MLIIIRVQAVSISLSQGLDRFTVRIWISDGGDLSNMRHNFWLRKCKINGYCFRCNLQGWHCNRAAVQASSSNRNTQRSMYKCPWQIALSAFGANEASGRSPYLLSWWWVGLVPRPELQAASSCSSICLFSAYVSFRDSAYVPNRYSESSIPTNLCRRLVYRCCCQSATSVPWVRMPNSVYIVSLMSRLLVAENNM